MRLQDKVALVTGAGQGIGRAIALRLASDGANIAIVDLSEEKMNGVATEVRQLNRKATTFKADVSRRDEVYAAIDHAEEKLGGFDVMINNAGIVGHTFGGFDDPAWLDAAPREYETNVLGSLRVSQAFAPVLELLDR